MAKVHQLEYVYKLILTMYVIKNNFTFSRKLYSILQFVIVIQPLFFINYLTKFNKYQQNWCYEALDIVFRPDIALETFGKNKEFHFVMPFLIFLCEKILLFAFLQFYFQNETPENFIQSAKNSLMKRFTCLLISLYISLISSYFFRSFTLICLSSLNSQMIKLEENNWNYLLLVWNIITLLLLLFDQWAHILITDNMITTKITGLDKRNVTNYNILTTSFIMIIMLLTTQKDAEYVASLQNFLNLITTVILVIDQFKNSTYILTLQKTPFFIGVSINLTVCVALIFSSSLNNLYEPILVGWLPLLQILFILNERDETDQVKSLFFDKIEDNPQVTIILARMLNNDLNSRQKKFINQLIARYHSEICKSKKCKFCQHENILFPEYSGCITDLIYKQFITSKIQAHFASIQTKHHQNLKRNDIILRYTILLYDFGWMMKSIKIIQQLHGNQYHKLQLYTQKSEKITKELFEKLYSTVGKEQKSEFSSGHQNEVWLTKNLAELHVNFPLHFNFQQKMQIKYILHIGKFSIKSQLLGNSMLAQQQTLILEFISNYLESEQLLQQCKTGFINIIKHKLAFYKSLSKSEFISNDQVRLSLSLLTLCKELHMLAKYWKAIYKAKPSVKLHSLLCFYFGEIECNYSKAIKFYRNQKFFDADLIQNEKIRNFNINKKNIEYIILELQENMQHLEIVNSSRQFFKYYGSKKNNNARHEFSDLVPINIAIYHEIYVKRFFDEGNCKFYNAFHLNFITNPYQLITTINMCFTITNLYKSSNLTFAVFIQEASEDQSFLLIDGKSFTCTLTKNLLLLIGWMEDEISLLCSGEKLEEINISTVFPNFLKLIKMSKTEIKLNSALFYFPLPLGQNEQRKSNRSTLVLQLNEKHNKLEYSPIECDVVITKRQVEQYEYFIIDIVKISSLLFDEQQGKITTITPQQIITDIKLESTSDGPKIGSINSINFLNSKLFPSINTVGFEIVKLHQEDKEISSQNQRRGKSSRNGDTVNVSKNQLLSSRQLDNNLLSPKQQDIFSSSIENSYIDQEKKIKKQIDQKSSQIEKVNKLYELVEQFQQLKSTNLYLKLLLAVYAQNCLFASYVILQIIYLDSDLNTFIQNIQMMAFNSAIMSPHDLFFSMRITITTYQDMNIKRYISQDKLSELTEPYYSYIDLGYTELRDSFYEQFNNQFLQQFLNNVNITMNFMQDNSTEIYPMITGFRDALFILLQYEYDSMRTFVNRSSTSGKPFQVSLYANYLNLHSISYSVTMDMKQFTIEKFNQIQQKWIILWIIFNISLIFLFLFVLRLEQRFFIALNELISLVNHLDDQNIQAEIRRNESILVAMNNDITQFERYHPELSLYDKLNGKIVSEVDHHLQVLPTQRKVYTIKQRKIFDILLVTVLLLFIISYSLTIIINFEGYMSKYINTTNLFQQISDMRLRPGSLYLYREILFRWNNFTFLTAENKQQIYGLIDLAQESISNYQNLFLNISFDHYLINNDLINAYNGINTNNLCTYIDQVNQQSINFQKFTNLTSKYCDISLEGSILKGMISSLTYISNQIASQQAINNFTSRVEYNLYEQEGSQIITRVFFVLSNQLSTSIEQVTKQLQQLIQVNYEINNQIVSGCYLGYIAIVQILLIYYYQPYLSSLVKTVKRSIQLIPFETLISNQYLERRLKELINKFKQH